MAERTFLFMNENYGYPEEAAAEQDTTTLRGATFTHKWQPPAVKVVKLISDEDMSGADPVGPALGDAYVVNNWLSQTDGDIVEWDGSIWNIIVTNAAGEPPDGTIVAVTDDTAAGSFAGEEANIGTYDATGNSWTFDEPEEGWFLSCDGAGSIYQYAGFLYDATGPSWHLAYGDTYEASEAKKIEDTIVNQEIIAARKVVCWGTTNNQIKVADNSADTTSRVIGIARTGGAASPGTSQVVKYGPCAGALNGAGVVNTPYYLGAAGALVVFASVPKPGRIIRMGYGINANDIDVQIIDFGRSIS